MELFHTFIFWHSSRLSGSTYFWF